MNTVIFDIHADKADAKTNNFIRKSLPYILFSKLIQYQSLF